MWKLEMRGMYTKHKWKSDRYFNFSYVKYLPKNYDSNKKYPLVFFLHGAGERGDDLDVAMRHGFMKYVREDGAEYPFIFIAPQCPHNKYWGCYTESLIAFLDYVCEELPVDKSRIYLTGLSMGGREHGCLQWQHQIGLLRLYLYVVQEFIGMQMS